MFFEQVPEGAPDPVFGLLGAFNEDPRPHKLSLMVGTYKDPFLRNTMLPVLREVQKKKQLLDEFADYLPIDGSPEFCDLIGELCFGQSIWKKIGERVYSTQSVGGTGALRVGADFIAREVGRTIWIPQPTWPNHRTVFERAGFTVQNLPYYDSKSHSFNREGYFGAIRALAPKSVVLFHTSCHNPTGCDPSHRDWNELADLCQERELLPFFDTAYQGFGLGIEQDTYPVRHFAEKGLDFLVAYSCSKNFSLYCQRVGALFVVTSNPSIQSKVGSQVKRIIRSLYSNPPAHGALMVAEILKNREWNGIWRDEVDEMRSRISSMREKLIEKIEAKSRSIDFSFIRNHKGMFSYLDLSKNQVDRLIEEFGVYTLDSGRINVAGLNEQNIDYFVESLLNVCAT